MFNVKRPDAIPASLAAGNSYRETDVCEALLKIFHGKCYLCETDELLAVNIEHFVSHRQCSEKKYDWENLFFACPRCNNFKGHSYDDILNCTDVSVDVLRLIKLVLPVSPGADIVVEAQSGEPNVVRTADLVTSAILIKYPAN